MINSLNFFLKLSYCLDVAAPEDTPNNNKYFRSLRKAEVQRRLRKYLGLIVDRPKVNYGSSNDGNTARKFFREYTETARCTGLDPNVLERFHVILSTLNTIGVINPDRFEQYVAETREVLKAAYPWKVMTPTVHKMLHHAPQFVREYEGQISFYSEEASESRNKDFKSIRRGYTRKSKRENTNKDIMTRMLITSSPFLNEIRSEPVTRRKELHKDAQRLMDIKY